MCMEYLVLKQIKLISLHCLLVVNYYLWVLSYEAKKICSKNFQKLKVNKI